MTAARRFLAGLSEALAYPKPRVPPPPIRDRHLTAGDLRLRLTLESSYGTDTYSRHVGLHESIEAVAAELARAAVLHASRRGGAA